MPYPIRHLIVGGALVAALPGSAVAQDSEGDPLAGGMGQFDLSGSLELGFGYDDNVYAQRNNKQSDGLWLLVPQVELSREGEIFDFKLFGDAEIGRYWSETSEDYADVELGFSVSAEVADDQEVFGGLSYAWEHEDRSSPDAANGIKPQEYTNLRGHLGYGATFGKTELRAGGTYERLDFDDVTTADQDNPIVDGDVRNRDLYTVGARVGRNIGDGWQVFGQGFGDFRAYEQESQFDRDSEGLTLAGGMRYRPAPNMNLEVLGGLIYQTYDDPRFDDVVTPDFGAQFDWRPNPRTRVSAHLDRTLEETTASDASGIVSTAAGVTVSRLLRRDLSLYGGLDVIQDDYQNIDRDELTFLADAGVRHFLSPHVYVDFNYNFARRDSDVSAFDYDNHQVFLSIGAQLDERFPEGAAAGFAAPELKGFYGGVQASLGSLHSELEGPRGEDEASDERGVLTTDFGAFGAGVGMFGGYGMSFEDWYLALELDGELSGAEWDHARSPGGRVFSVTKDWSIGVGPVVGYRLERGALPYARLGVVATSFDTAYMTRRGSQFGETQQEVGVRLGGGLEVPTGDGLFLRMDYSYTSYPDYDISPPSGDDNFANSESLVRMGLGYRFNDDDAADELPAYNPDGFYAGVQGGVTSLFSEGSGPRQDDSFLNADFSDEGLNLGAFGGYGQTFDRIYLGVEGDLEVGVARPDHERSGEGRKFSVDKQWSAGLNARVGYTLGPAGMVYLRGGPVISGFETDYEKGESSVSRSEGELGWRVGVGLETPLNDKLSLRVDYSYTDYEDYDVAYGDEGGIDNFDNSESLFRVGVAWRF